MSPSGPPSLWPRSASNERATRRLSPTEAGRALAERYRALHGTYDDVVWRCAAAVHELTLRVGAATREPWDTAR